MVKNNQKSVGYIRVSSQGQINGTGFDRQSETIDSFCKNHKLLLKSIYFESYTGTEDNRPVFNQMIEDLLTNGCRTIVVESLDRLARDLSVQMQILSYLISKELTLYNANTGQNITQSMQSDPMMKAMVQIQGTFAELEKSLLVRKLKAARDRTKQKKGKCEGRKPFGFYPGEKETLKYVLRLHRKPRGGKRLGFYQIAKILNQEGFKTRSGKSWHGITVKKIIEREKN